MPFFSFGKKADTDISPAEFKAGFENDSSARILDVRADAEVAQGMLPNAQQIDFFSRDFTSQLDKLPKENTYYVYCRSGKRSGKAVSHLVANGYKAFNLDGGILAWNKE